MNQDQRPRVFVPQEPSRFDRDLQLRVNSVDLSPALSFGEIIVCLPAGANFINSAPLVQALKEKLSDFNSNDYLMAAGDPTCIAVAAALAARKTGGHIKMLKWDRRVKQYQPIEINL